MRRAFDKLDVNKDGFVKLDDLQKLYDVSNHPAVLEGRKTQQ